MNAIKQSIDQKQIKSKLIMKKSKEAEQHSNAKIRMILKPRPKNICTKRV